MLTVRAFTFNPAEENTYILYNEQDSCCIIDPGCYFPAEREELREFLQNAGLQPVLLLNTHCHIDHVFGNQFVRDNWGLDLHLHEKERPILDWAPEAALLWQLPFDNYKGPQVYLQEGKTIKLGEDELEIRLVPGHSPGSVCFYYPRGGFVIGGDVLFNGSIGRTDLPGGDFDTLIHSIKTQLFTLPDETIVYPGHGPATSIGVEKKTNPFFK